MVVACCAGIGLGLAAPGERDLEVDTLRVKHLKVVDGNGRVVCVIETDGLGTALSFFGPTGKITAQLSGGTAKEPEEGKAAGLGTGRGIGLRLFGGDEKCRAQVVLNPLDAGGVISIADAAGEQVFKKP